MITKVLSNHAGPFWQFVKYGIIGVMSTLIDMIFFYISASLIFRCLAPGDPAVELLSLPCAEFTGEEPWYSSRGTLAAVDSLIGFALANIFCWLMNRRFVFVPGRYVWYKEFLFFFTVSALATFVAMGVMKILIDSFGMATTFAFAVKVAVSLVVNFFVRKFIIFKG